MQYIVKKGDNLSTIAKKSGIKLDDILKSNTDIKNPNYIQIGQKINLPEKKNGYITLKNNSGKPYKEFIEEQLKVEPPTWNKISPNAGKKPQIANFNKSNTPTAPVKKTKTVTPKKSEPSFFENLTNKVSEIYGDAKTAIDQQFSKKTVAKPKIEIINSKNSLIDYGYKELGTYKDQSFRAGKNDSLLSAMNIFDNEKGFDYVISPKLKEGIKTFKNVKGVAHFIMRYYRRSKIHISLRIKRSKNIK